MTAYDDFQYKVGRTYTTRDMPEICRSGFHFCQLPWHVDSFYSVTNFTFKYCLVQALGNIVHSSNKSATNKIKIIEEIPREQFLMLCNNGELSIGILNKGACNYGNNNIGMYNNGNNNNGNYNHGYSNIGNFNIGNRNNGFFNVGDYCSGDFNIGYESTGYFSSCKRPYTTIFDIKVRSHKFLSIIDELKSVMFSTLVTKAKIKKDIIPIVSYPKGGLMWRNIVKYKKILKLIQSLPNYSERRLAKFVDMAGDV